MISFYIKTSPDEAPTRYDFNPKKDITVYELALIIKWLYENKNWNPYPDNKCLRHFEEV